jgi:hypothetical protein
MASSIPLEMCQAEFTSPGTKDPHTIIRHMSKHRTATGQVRMAVSVLILRRRLPSHASRPRAFGVRNRQSTDNFRAHGAPIMGS